MSELDFDAGALANWLNEHTGRSGDIAVEPMRGGGSCEMFSLTQGADRFVIRRAPLAAVSDTAAIGTMLIPAIYWPLRPIELDLYFRC